MKEQTLEEILDECIDVYILKDDVNSRAVLDDFYSSLGFIMDHSECAESK